MLRRSITATALALVALLACWLYVPWNQVQTNGTGDGSLSYDRLGYAFIWDAPKPDKAKISSYSKVSVQPDWLILSVLTLVFGGIAFFCFPKKEDRERG